MLIGIDNYNVVVDLFLGVFNYFGLFDEVYFDYFFDSVVKFNVDIIVFSFEYFFGG